MVASRASWLIGATILLAGCGSSAPTVAPTSVTPVAAPLVEIAGQITDTVTGQLVGAFTQSGASLPARVTVSAPGYVTRETWATTSTPSVDLFPERGFDLGFYRQFARRELDNGGRVDPLRVWTAQPGVALRAGLPAATVAALEAVARQTIPALTGGRLSMQSWAVTGESSSTGTVIDVEMVNEPDGTSCGRAEVGGRRIWLNRAPRCAWRGHPVYVPLLGHELGHVLGFSHVTAADALMSQARIREAGPSEMERYHAALAYARQPGNTDVDVDPPLGTRGTAVTVVVD